MYAAEKLIDHFIEKFNIQVGLYKEQLANNKRDNIDEKEREVHHTILDIQKLIAEENFHETLTEEYKRFVKAYESLERKLELVSAFVPESQFDERVLQAPPVAEIVRDVEQAIVRNPLTAEEGYSLMDYTVNDVLGVLRSLGLSHLCVAFEKANVDGGVLMIADEGTLTELGVTSNVERKKILAWVMKQQRSN